MGSFEPTHLMFLLFTVAVIAAIGGSIGSALARRRKRRTRTFIAGIFCGFTLAAVLRQRRHGLTALGAAARRAGFRLPVRVTPTRRRQLHRARR
jgi:hypothetical protein